MDTHPIHFHLFDVQLVNRVGWDGIIRKPDANELGWKDTVQAPPGMVTRIAVPFGSHAVTGPIAATAVHRGEYVWHCHILEHEDNDMMRPMRIGPRQPGQPG